MAWHYVRSTCSQGPAVESWDACYSDTIPFALSRLIPTGGGSYSRGSVTAIYRRSLSGMMSGRLTGHHGADTAMSCPEGFPVPGSVAPDPGQGSQTADLRCGGTWLGSLTRSAHGLCGLRTPPDLFNTGSVQYCVTFPIWGTARGGDVWAHDTPAHHTDAIGSGYWLATPTSTWNQLSPYMQRWPGCRAWVGRAGKVGDTPSPDWVEWLMGWPIGWTDCRPLGPDRFLTWYASHGGL